MPLVLLGHPLNHPFSMMLSQNLIFVIVFTVHFHVTTWVEAGGATVWGEGGPVCEKPSKPFGRSAFSYWSLQHPAFQHQPDSRTKTFSPNCKCDRSYVPIHMNRQNLSKTLKVAKKSISSHKLFIILVTSTIHYANDNNCKGISQDRMHEHHVLKTAKIPICQICFVEGIYTKHFFIEVFCTISISMVFWFHQHQTSIFDERHTSDFNNLALSLKSIAFCQLKAAWTE